MTTQLLRMLLAALIFVGITTPAHAQATRTWVSGVGDDVNPCSRTAPCKTFAGAISKTAAGGEINCLDPGGFGAVTITKSIIIDCTGTFGSTLHSGTNGINVNDSLSAAPNTANVVLRGIAINGAGTTLGLNSINFTSGRSLVVENVSIENASQRGINFAPVSSARLTVINTTITNATVGIRIAPTGVNGSVRANLENVRLADNASEGLRVDSNGSTSASATLLDADEINLSGSTTGVIVVATGGTPSAVHLTNSTIFNNGTALAANGANAQIRAALNTITGNGTTTLSVSSGAIRSYGTNRTEGNSTPPTFTPPTLTAN